MVVSGRKLGLLAAVGVLLVALLPAACTGEEADVFVTTPTTLFPSQQAFMQELSDDGYIVGMFTEQQEDAEVLVVWVPVDAEKTTPAANDAIFDHVVALAEKYGAAEAAGGRLRVELFDPSTGGLVGDHIFESRDFDLAESDGHPTTTSTGVTTTSTSLAMTESAPSDFGFVAGYGVMGRNVIDTFAGTFTKDLGARDEPVTTELTLPPDALEALYQDLVLMQKAWHTFTTPFAPDPDPANTGTSMFVQPHQTYRLEWQAGGFHSLPIVWEDSALSTDLEAVALRDWFEDLRQMIEATPEWKALPPAEGGYA